MASSTTGPFPPFPLTGIQFPSSPIIYKAMPQFSKLGNALDVELVVVSCLLHDLTWTKKRDFVNLTRHFIDTFPDKDIIWDSIALQMMEALAPWKEPEVAPVHYGINGDLLGPNLHLFGLPDDLPNLRGVMIDEKQRYTFDSGVINYGIEWRYDGKDFSVLRTYTSRDRSINLRIKPSR
ncbi:hypothetical protein ACQKWADRAFT_325003 [Trichoderma austrokoningii]